MPNLNNRGLRADLEVEAIRNRILNANFPRPVMPDGHIIPDMAQEEPVIVDPDFEEDHDEEEDIDGETEFFNNLTVGADPELFIINSKTGNVVSSIGLIPGKKNDAWRDPDWQEGYGLETDNILAEFNIPPSQSTEEFVTHMNFMKDYIRNFVKKTNPDYDIMCKASAHVPTDQLQSDEARLFGCSVDYNVYSGGPNPKPKGETTNLRSTGLHIHVGYKNPNVNHSLEMIKYMDMYLGVPSITVDSDTERRQLYGKAGCFRITPYGFEYRTLSGYFLSTDDLIKFCYDGTIRAMHAWYNGYQQIPSNEIQQTINNGDVSMAKKLIKKYHLFD